MESTAAAAAAGDDDDDLLVIIGMGTSSLRESHNSVTAAEREGGRTNEDNHCSLSCQQSLSLS